MSIPKRIIAAFAGVFLAGALAGGLLVITFQGDRLSTFLSHAENPTHMATHIDQRLAHDLGLSADEQGRVAPLVREMTLRLYRQRRDFGVDVLNTLDKYHPEIEAAMNPEHRKAYEKDIQERRDRLAALLLLDQNPPSGTR